MLFIFNIEEICLSEKDRRVDDANAEVAILGVSFFCMAKPSGWASKSTNDNLLDMEDFVYYQMKKRVTILFLLKFCKYFRK